MFRSALLAKPAGFITEAFRTNGCRHLFAMGTLDLGGVIPNDNFHLAFFYVSFQFGNYGQKQLCRGAEVIFIKQFPSRE
jgi:hypothetical protein